MIWDQRVERKEKNKKARSIVMPRLILEMQCTTDQHIILRGQESVDLFVTICLICLFFLLTS